ncbi:hypothetical protein QBC46DRAFT_369497 [Diplogelasinospora grovesii]|uniref:Secreted protein n=1 Tax=Diplogelasinospora grovesii TaxID=303347 RepID=A0AAN6NIB9_9PEZI|nr:hypothetical protein QBC46DRAFT_369497 [Diplogelasinospora grovesii]
MHLYVRFALFFLFERAAHLSWLPTFLSRVGALPFLAPNPRHRTGKTTVLSQLAFLVHSVKAPLPKGLLPRFGDIPGRDRNVDRVVS